MGSKLDKLKAMKTDNALSIEEMDEIAGGDYKRVRGRQPVPECTAAWSSGAAGSVR